MGVRPGRPAPDDRHGIRQRRQPARSSTPRCTSRWATTRSPGLSLAIFGQYFNRNETWAGMARPWVDYMARSSWLLQQGRFYADVAYFYGEEAPLVSAGPASG
jgi:hypothetical protein